MSDKAKRPKRKTTALDRAVIKFRKGKKKSFNRIYADIRPTIIYVAKKFAHLFPDKDVDDLIQEAYLLISTKVIPAYDPERASFKTLVKIATTNQFRTMVRRIMHKEKTPDDVPIITFTEFEIDNVDGILDIPDAKGLLDDVLINDFLVLFQERLTRDSWGIYYRLYRDPNSDFKIVAREMSISMMSLYRKCRSIYAFLKMLIEKEGNDE